MAKFDIDLVGKVGSLALIDKAYGDINYSTIARISRELRPGIIWVTSGATEIGRLDFIKRTGRELTGSDEDNKTDYSAQGQSVLMGWYRQFVDSRFSLRQILVEHQHFNDAEKREYLKQRRNNGRNEGNGFVFGRRGVYGEDAEKEPGYRRGFLHERYACDRGVQVS